MSTTSFLQRLRSVILLAIACAGVLTSFDAACVLWVFGLRHTIGTGFCRYAALAAGTYALFAILAYCLGWLIWQAFRRTRLGSAMMGEVLLGPGWALGLVSVLWAMAATDFSWGDDVIRYRLWAYGLIWLSCFLAIGCVVGYCAARVAHAWRRFRALRIGLAAAASALLCCTLAIGLCRTWSHVRARLHSSPTRPNVILITVDALRQDALSCYGSNKARTPNIDRLAREGVKFSYANSACPWTRPSCASFHLSVYPTCHGMGGLCTGDDPSEANAMPAALTTLAQAFQANGYVTQAFVTNPQVSRVYGFDRGFDDYCMYEDVGDRTAGLSLSEAASPARMVARHASRLLQFEWVKRHPRPDDCLAPQFADSFAPSGAFLTAAAARWLRHAPQPFFLWVHYMEVHQYLSLDITMPEHGGPARTDLTRVAAAAVVTCPEGLDVVAVMDSAAVAGENLDPNAPVECDPPSYFNNVEYVDALVGCLLSELDRLGLANHTHVVFSSDHGEELGERGRLAHGHTQYEEVTRVPLIVRGPALADSGRTLVPRCSLIDLAPTFAELAHIPKPRSFAGRSLMPAIRGQEMPARPVCSEFLSLAKHERKALRYEMMKCISADRGRQAELYDLRKDPGEQESLAAKQPLQLRKMLDMLSAWQQEQTVHSINVRGRKQGKVKIDAEMRERLRALGY